MKAPLPTKRSSVLGMPVGRRQTDWARVGKLGALGVGALSTAAGGVGAKRAGGRLKEKVNDQVEQEMEQCGYEMPADVDGGDGSSDEEPAPEPTP